MNIQKSYTSAIGKLYQEVQENSQLDKIVTDLYYTLEFEIKTGERLPIKIKAEEVRGMPSKDIDYVEKELHALGCKGHFYCDVFKSDKRIEYVLEDLVWV